MFDRRVLAAAALAVLLAPVGAAGQDWRTVTRSRQFAGERVLEVDVEYGAGELRIEPAPAGVLYRSSLRYDGASFRPVSAYADGRLRLGIDGKGNVRSLKMIDKARLDIAIGPEAPLDLTLDFGAVKADLELGGLRTRSLQVATGASETTVRFSRPNRESMRRMEIEAGAAAFRAVGLGNANAETIDFRGGVGDIILDFTGEWRRDMHGTIEMGMGAVTLVLPRGLGVRIDKETFLTSFDSEGLIKRGSSYYSEGWESAEHRLTLAVSAALGSIAVRWVDGTTAKK